MDRGQHFLGVAKQEFGPEHPSLCVTPLRAEDTPVPAALCESLSHFLQQAHRSFAEALESLRFALCAACVAGEAIQAALEWAVRQLEQGCEDVSVQTAGMLRWALEWAVEHWTPQWICGGEADTAAQYQVFRDSETLLFAMDFDEIAAVDGSPRPTKPGFLLCPRGTELHFSGYQFGWGDVVAVEDALIGAEWLSRMQTRLLAAEGCAIFVAAL